MNKNYYIADLHFGHSKIISICNRPFEDVNEMNEKLIENWNKRIDDSDTVYLLGDVSYTISKEKVIELLNRLNGIKVLLTGNHDRFVGQRDFDSCFKCVRQIMSVADEGRQVVLSHYPIVDYPGMFYGSYMVYGHIHDKYIPHKKMFCASVENINYEPVTLDELIEIYKDKNAKDEIDWATKF